MIATRISGGDSTGARTAGTVSLDRFPVGLDGSWNRCINHGLRRQDRALFSQSVDRALSRRIVEESHFLIAHAGAEMDKLHRTLDSSRWLTLCTDTKGQIVHFVGNRCSAPSQLQTLMYPGRGLLEAEIGTTAPGCALEERRTIIVARSEHFLLELEEFFCASAPIFDPANRLAGVLDISGVDVRALPLASDLVEFAVRRVENNMVSALERCTLLRFHSDERLLGSPFEAMLAVDASGLIKGSNRTAGQLLGQAAGLLNQPVDGLIEGGWHAILRRLREAKGQPVRISSDGAWLSFVGSEQPNQRTRSLTVSVHGANGAGTFICEDPSFRSAYVKAVKVLAAGLPVVLHGETGTGKEVVARSMHQAVRPSGPFVALNCAAIPESLIEAELFGYADGAFTGARKGGSCGKIEQAHAGVLLLDEIGDMSLPLQSRLLRVLQERTVTRVGHNREIPVDLLVICATHRNLQELVENGQFREDLFYRLHGYSLSIPPLRERSDAREIVRGLLRRWSDAGDNANVSDDAQLIPEGLMTEEAMECLARYSWPGNIRQLEKVIRMLLALRQPDEPIGLADLPAEVRGATQITSVESPVVPRAGDETLAAVQVEVIHQALAKHRGNVSAAARALGISRGTLYKKLRSHST
jgi:transcriptional regulator of acetoin/glycerol metabolism